jgi:hypothetical protein
MADELEKKEVVFYEGRWVRVEDRKKHDTTKAGESAAKAAATAVVNQNTTATAEKAVVLQAEILELGEYVKDEYEGVPATTATPYLNSLKCFSSSGDSTGGWCLS